MNMRCTFSTLAIGGDRTKSVSNLFSCREKLLTHRASNAKAMVPVLKQHLQQRVYYLSVVDRTQEALGFAATAA